MQQPVVEKGMNMGSIALKPERAMVNVTGKCNSRCGYCRAWRVDAGEHDPTRRELLELMGQVAGLGCAAVGFSGGEPLLRDDLEEVIDCAVGHGLTTGAVTNGLLLTPKRASSLAAAGLGSLSVSLDSLDPDVYRSIRGVSLEKVLRNLKSAASGAMPMGISTTISGRNIDALEDLVRFAQETALLISFQLYESGVHLANDDDVFKPSLPKLQAAMDTLCALKDKGAPITNSYEYLQTVPAYARNGEWVGLERCIAPRSEVCVDEELCVHTCWGLDRKMGDLRKTGLSEIWNSDAFDQERSRLQGCRQCILSCHFDNSLRVLAREEAVLKKGDK
jgi:MoaA/NifB/PqqE/SkfB family radical SAM enzyme